MNLNSRGDQAFQKRLTDIVEANLSNEQFGVSELAVKMGLSRSQIHRRLKKENNQSVSQFIREIRLKKAKGYLEQGNFTVSEIAYKVGFGSPSYFIKCFHEEYGYSPGEITKLNKEAAGMPLKKRFLSGKRIKSVKFPSKNRVLLALIFVTLSFLFIISIIIKNNRHELEKSIAVLPLEYLGNNEETQSLSLGIMEDILTRLSHVQGLKVKSRMSAERFSQRNMTIQEIGREMDVAYVLEGSIIKEKNSVRIYVQLIETETDNHVWSEQYDRDLSGILTVVSDVSMNITDKLQVILSPEEVEQIEKVYTANTEAYKLYQKGRFFWHKRTEEDVNRSIYYFNEALKFDSNFALAYAGLADAYFIEAWWKWMSTAEAINKSKLYAKKALEIDNTLAEVHAVLGGIACWFDCDWRTSEKELKRAIELNPNSAISHQYYSEYLDIVNRGDEARKHIEIAIDLNPNFKINYVLSSLYFYHAENYEMALKVGEKVLELEKNYWGQYWRNFWCHLKLGNDSLAINDLLKITLLSESTSNYKDSLYSLYNESNMEAVILWIIDNRELMVEKNSTYYIAASYLYLNEQGKALDLLENYDVEGIVPFQRINCNPDFNSLRENPRFVALLGKMNLPVK